MASQTYVEKTGETSAMVEYRFGAEPEQLNGHFAIDKRTLTVTAASATPQAEAERTAGWLVFQMKKRGTTDWLARGMIAT